MDVFLGIDLGTSSVKTTLLSTEGNIVGSGHCALSLSVPRPGFAEQNPLEWWDSTVRATQQALSSCKEIIKVSGIGISGQMLGSVLLDREGKVLEDCIIWMDQRSHEECAKIENVIGLEGILERTANYPLVSYWASKLLWLRKHRPETFGKIDKVLFPKDYLKFRLTGVYDIDVTDAAGSMLFDTARRTWDWDLFDKLDIPRSLVPPKVSESTAVIGKLTEISAQQLGISPGVQVIAGAGDQMSSAVGLGVVKEGIISSTIGTSGCVFSYSDRCIIDRKPRAILSYCHSISGKWCLYGCTISAGGAYKWLGNIVNKSHSFLEAGERDIFAFMNKCAALADPGSEGLIFLPYLNGERTPYPDPYARGVFFGLSNRHGLNEICRSVLEGVSYSLLDTIEILREYDIPINQVRVSGGGASSPLWLQIQADIFNAPIVTTNITESSAVGAAMLSAVGTGYFNNVEEAAERVVRKLNVIEPNPENVPLYRDFYETYNSLYPALKKLYAEQALKVGRWL